MITISICLSDIPAEARHKANNGKVYANFCIDERKEPDQYGNTHSVWVSQTREERQARAEKKYVGSGKEYKFGNSGNSNQQPSGLDSFPTQTDYDDQLPF